MCGDACLQWEESVICRIAIAPPCRCRGQNPEGVSALSGFVMIIRPCQINSSKISSVGFTPGRPDPRRSPRGALPLGPGELKQHPEGHTGLIRDHPAIKSCQGRAAPPLHPSDARSQF